MSRTDIIEVDDSPMEIYTAIPEGDGPFGGVAVMFHRGGLDDFTRDICDRLAAAGFAAAAPDKYHRSPQDMDASAKRDEVSDRGMLADIDATVDYMRRQPGIKSDALAIMGHCMGGRTSYLGAAMNPAFRTTLAWYGGHMFASFDDGGTPPFELLKGIGGKVMGFYGNDDKNPSPDDVNKFDAELTKLGIDHEFHRYDGAGHAFMNNYGKSYREAQSNDSWAKALEFLSREIG